MNGYQIVSEIFGLSQREQRNKLLRTKWLSLPIQEKLRYWNISYFYHKKHHDWIVKYKEFKITGTKLTDSQVTEYSKMDYDAMMHAENQIKKLKSGDGNVPISPFFKG